MSLILDALRKSEWERQRGVVPTIYSSHHPVGQRSQRAAWSILILTTCAVTFLGVYAWSGGSVGVVDNALLTARNAGAEPTTSAAAAVPAKVVAPAAAIPDAADETQTPVSEPAQQHALEVAAVQPQSDPGNTSAGTSKTSAGSGETETPAEAEQPPQPIEPRHPPKQLAHAGVETKSPPRNDVRQRARQQTAVRASGSGRKVAAPAIRSVPPAAASRRETESPSGSDRVPMLWELPESITRTIPELQVTMHVYSDNASNRFLRLNGENYHEKDRIAQGLVLEMINEEGAVMNYKGTRFQLEP